MGQQDLQHSIYIMHHENLSYPAMETIIEAGYYGSDRLHKGIIHSA